MSDATNVYCTSLLSVCEELATRSDDGAQTASAPPVSTDSVGIGSFVGRVREVIGGAQSRSSRGNVEALRSIDPWPTRAWVVLYGLHSPLRAADLALHDLARLVLLGAEARDAPWALESTQWRRDEVVGRLPGMARTHGRIGREATLSTAQAYGATLIDVSHVLAEHVRRESSQRPQGSRLPRECTNALLELEVFTSQVAGSAVAYYSRRGLQNRKELLAVDTSVVRQLISTHATVAPLSVGRAALFDLQRAMILSN